MVHKQDVELSVQLLQAAVENLDQYNWSHWYYV
jgi:endoglucanase